MSNDIKIFLKFTDNDTKIFCEKLDKIILGKRITIFEKLQKNFDPDSDYFGIVERMASDGCEWIADKYRIGKVIHIDDNFLEFNDDTITHGLCLFLKHDENGDEKIILVTITRTIYENSKKNVRICNRYKLKVRNMFYFLKSMMMIYIYMLK